MNCWIIQTQAHAGYFDRDFQMPWRFYHIHPNETIAEHKLRHPSPFSKYTAPKGWNRVGHFHRAQLMRQQLRSRMNICSVYGHFQKVWKIKIWILFLINNFY